MILDSLIYVSFDMFLEFYFRLRQVSALRISSVS